MDAQLVWDTWRAILTDDDLAEAVSHPGLLDDDAFAALGTPERAVAAEYARTPQATATNIGMYRRGLIRNALAALSRTPVTQHLLYASGLDADAVAADFAQANGYADDGPNFWRIAGEFIAYLATRPEFSAQAHQDVLALDSALVSLARGLGARGVPVWPGVAADEVPVGEPSVSRSARFVASSAATTVASQHDLAPWIEDPRGYDPTESLAASPHHWLIYFPAAESDPAYAELSGRTARIFEVLSTPKTAAEAASELGDLPAREALTVIGSLSALGVVLSDGGGPNA